MTGHDPHPMKRLSGGKGIAGASAAGLAAVFAVSPLAHAAPTAPHTPAPAKHNSSGAAAAGATSTPKTSPKAAKVSPRIVTPTYGFQKFRVGVQKKDGAYVPPGATTVGTQLTVTETGPDAGQFEPANFTCTTDASTATSGSTATFCLATQVPRNQALAKKFARPALTTQPTPAGAPPDQQFTAAPGDTVTITQKTVNAGFVIDSGTATLDRCTVPPGFFIVCTPPGFPDATKSTDEIFDDNGLPPVARDDGPKKVVSGHAVDIDVLANDTTHGAPVTSVQVATDPSHGTATVSGHTINYTAKAGFVGTDHFTYRFTTANGTASATVTVTVAAPPPTARDDSASTTSGHAVTVDVTGNDDANGGGALSVTSASDPAHGSAKIDGDNVVYTPASSFVGTDHFTYTISTAGGSDTATVTVTVAAPAAPDSNAAGGLVDTGVDSSQLLDLAIALIIAGAGATAVGRRRRVVGPDAD